ncbi:H2O-forming NADH oxidase [Scatolibacter rhodanostii]|uniref:H2O-forming NADH oxidase n=1 Tax=Scatolibacter rhodanostii TaxID=2014781 RepID=UPI000C08A893|nr:FAD-dependent oxidoreductase [Scatolibacter rhodanostii]
MKKIVLIGANHAGTAAANTILDQYPDYKLKIFDRNSNISYLGCGTALWIGKQIHSTEGLFYSSPEALRAKGADILAETEVKNIDFAGKTVKALTKSGEEITESYDKLIIASGSVPIHPRIPGIDLENVRHVKLFQDGQAINEALESDDVKNVIVVGAGYIGVEIAEAAQRRGKNTFLFESADTSLSSYYDPWFTKDMDENLQDHGVKLRFGETITEICGDGKVESVKTTKGEYPADLVLLAIGFVPNTSLIGDSLEKFRNGAILVDKHQQTSDPDVYAIGDSATVWNNATGKQDYIALATNAVRSGIVAAHNACGTALESSGVQGSNGISIYGLNMVSTGLNLAAAKKAGFDPLYTEYEDLQKPGFIENNNYKVKIRIVYDKETRRVLGAQMESYQDISMGIHMFSLAIEQQLTIDKLALLDIFFLPHFNQPYNYITMAALNAK